MFRRGNKPSDVFRNGVELIRQIRKKSSIRRLWRRKACLASVICRWNDKRSGPPRCVWHSDDSLTKSQPSRRKSPKVNSDINHLTWFSFHHSYTRYFLSALHYWGLLGCCLFDRAHNIGEIHCRGTLCFESAKQHKQTKKKKKNRRSPPVACLDFVARCTRSKKTG